ncbi:MAG: acetylglutamate kinase [Kiritimatiellia bacterium]|nr:acetylglutamate kinase [Lentisphaerota bacterium]
MQSIIEKAGVLIEAMPYIQAFRGEVVVIKFGGSAMEDRACHDGILADAAFMESVGLYPIIVHGGGKAISRRMSELGLNPVFRHGLRVTDAAAIEVVAEVLNHHVNVEIVETLVSFGAKAVGIQGPSIIQARKHVVLDEQGQPVDLGFVGQVDQVDPAQVLACLRSGMIPVVTPLGRDDAGQIYNINADDAAAGLARALQARKLVFLSDVPGILSDAADPASVISSLRQKDVADLINRGIIAGGMRPKIQGALDALDAGVKKVHIIDGGLPHSLLLEIFTDQGIGTEILKND